MSHEGILNKYLSLFRSQDNLYTIYKHTTKSRFLGNWKELITKSCFCFCFKKAEKAMAPHSSTLAWKIPWAEEPGRLQSLGLRRVGHDWDFTFTFHFHVLEKEMATHSSVLAWRIPGTGEPGGLLSMGLHRVGHDWSDLAAGAAGTKRWQFVGK